MFVLEKYASQCCARDEHGFLLTTHNTMEAL
jgi:hypothetical protein